ncbi:hypothetical protein CPB97_003117 [Podila verticillata]|nr:hypothetical protein CPB97_003117 [Podila verticillata]
MHLEQYQERNEAAKCFEDDLDFCPSLTPREVSEFKLASILAQKERNKKQQQRSGHTSPTLSTPSPRTSRAISIVDPISGAPLFMPRASSPPSPTSSIGSSFFSSSPSSENTPFASRRTSSLGSPSSPTSGHFSAFPPGFNNMGSEYAPMTLTSRQKHAQLQRQQEQQQLQQQLELDALYQQQELDSLYQQQMDAMYAYQFSGPFSSSMSSQVWGSSFPMEMVMMGPPSPVYAPSHLPPSHMARSWHQSFVAVR